MLPALDGFVVVPSSTIVAPLLSVGVATASALVM